MPSVPFFVAVDDARCYGACICASANYEQDGAQKGLEVEKRGLDRYYENSAAYVLLFFCSLTMA